MPVSRWSRLVDTLCSTVTRVGRSVCFDSDEGWQICLFGSSEVCLFHSDEGWQICLFHGD